MSPADAITLETMYRVAWQVSRRFVATADTGIEDLVQECVLVGWKVRNTYEKGSASPTSYLFAVMRRRLIDLTRARLGRNGEKRLAFVQMHGGDDELGPIDTRASGAPIPGRNMEVREEIATWHKRHPMDRRDALILVLRYGAGLKTKETAAVCGCTLGRVSQLEQSLRRRYGLPKLDYAYTPGARRNDHLRKKAPASHERGSHVGEDRDSPATQGEIA